MMMMIMMISITSKPHSTRCPSADVENQILVLIMARKIGRSWENKVDDNGDAHSNKKCFLIEELFLVYAHCTKRNCTRILFFINQTYCIYLTRREMTFVSSEMGHYDLCVHL